MSSATVQQLKDTPKNSNSTNKRKPNWRCDLCLEAVFDDYDMCVAHKKECTANVGGKMKSLSRRRPSSKIVQGGTKHKDGLL